MALDTVLLKDGTDIRLIVHGQHRESSQHTREDPVKGTNQEKFLHDRVNSLIGGAAHKSPVFSRKQQMNLHVGSNGLSA